MATIFIHHHVQDRFAAEIIAGTLVDCGQVLLRPHHALGPARLIPERLGVDWHVVLWTPHSATQPAIVDLVDTLARFRGPLMVLAYDVDCTPAGVRAESMFPLLDRDVAWTVYRAALRRRLHYAEETYPYRLREDARIAALRDMERTLSGWLTNTYVLPVAVLAGVVLWTIAGG